MDPGQVAETDHQGVQAGNSALPAPGSPLTSARPKLLKLSPPTPDGPGTYVMWFTGDRSRLVSVTEFFVDLAGRTGHGLPLEPRNVLREEQLSIKIIAPPASTFETGRDLQQI